jgi:tetratricopeptide (TPR) repeat protein
MVRALAGLMLLLQLAGAAPDAETWWHRGVKSFEQGRFAEAEQSFLNVTRLNPKHGGAYALLALSEVRLKKYETAFAHLVLARKHGLIPGTDLERMAEEHYLMLANRIGRFEFANGLAALHVKTRGASPIAEQVAGLSALRMRLLPSEVPEADRAKVTAAGRSLVLAWQGRLAEAKEQAGSLGHVPNAHYLMGYLLTLENSDAALEEFKKELEVSPKHVQARLRIAEGYLHRGEAAKGLPYVEHATRLAPGDFSARLLHGRVLVELNRLADGIRHLEKAAAIAPQAPEVHLHLANALSRAGREAEAEKHRKMVQQLKASTAAAVP